MKPSRHTILSAVRIHGAGALVLTCFVVSITMLTCVSLEAFPFYEPFDYPAASTLVGQTTADGLTWLAAGPAGSDITVRSPGLSFGSLPAATGNLARVEAGIGPSALLPFSTIVNNGSVYFSLLLKVNDLSGLSSEGAYVVGFNPGAVSQATTPTVLGSRVFLRANSGGYNVGLAMNSGAPSDATWDPRTFGTNDTILLVGGYTFNPGPGVSDLAELWIFASPSVLTDELPPPDLTNQAGLDLARAASFVVLQRPAPDQPAVFLVDELRFGLMAQAVVPPGHRDFGDAPAPYPTLLADNGARHRIVPGWFLGSRVDWESNGIPDLFAAGDDADGSINDEDGVSFPAPVRPGADATVEVVASTNGFLDAWIDIDRNGAWDAAEHIFDSTPLTAGTNLLTFAVPGSAISGQTYGRFRFSASGGLGVGGFAPVGEVEDVLVDIARPEPLVFAGAEHAALGSAVLRAPTGELTVSALGLNEPEGVAISLQAAAQAGVQLEPVAFSASDRALTISAFGSYAGQLESYLGLTGLRRANGVLELYADFAGSVFASNSLRIAVFNNAQPVGLVATPQTNVPIAGAANLVSVHVRANPLSYVFDFDQPMSLAPGGQPPLQGNRVEVSVPASGDAVDFLSSLVLAGRHFDTLRILNETQQSALPHLRIACDQQSPIVTWTWPGATLEAGPTVKGPWNPVRDASDPFRLSLTNKSQLFRLAARHLIQRVEPRVGVNFLALRRNPTNLNEPDEVLADLDELGARIIRQMADQDVMWMNLQTDPTATFDFTGPDELFNAIDAGGYSMVVVPTLFQISGDRAFCSNKLCTPDGTIVTDASVKSEVETYVTKVTGHYHDETEFFEIGNELKQYSDFNAANYADLLRLCRDAFDTVDPNLKIVLGGMLGTVSNQIPDQLTWLNNVVTRLNSTTLDPASYLDVINFHYYDDWASLKSAITQIEGWMAGGNSIGETFNLPLWLTETGRSHTPPDGHADELHRADDSEEEQAADVFRRFSVAFGNGVERACWHSYVSSSDAYSPDPGSAFWGFGLVFADGSRSLAWYSYRLFADELDGFTGCTALSEGPTVWAYRYAVPVFRLLRGGPYRYKWVIWSAIPDESYPLTDSLETTVTQTSVVPKRLVIHLPAGMDLEPILFISSSVNPTKLRAQPTPILVEDGHWYTTP